MNKEIIKNARLGESYTRIQHDSGLTINLYPMKDFSSAFALFGTRYGSVDTTFRTGSGEFITVPEGIAHYLEHKLFESEECDAFELFSETGASSNAFTSFDCTAYHFSCADHFRRNLEILLGFVQHPYFTDENVQKEQGIIAQEIKSYLDDPGWRVFMNGLEGLYCNNPVRIDVAGTVESISHITKELLYSCYEAFYDLSNMTLCISGNFDEAEALDVCDRLLKPAKGKAPETKIPDEPREVAQKRVSQRLYCSMPTFELCFKTASPKDAKEQQKKYFAYNYFLDTVFGCFSPFYTKLYDKGLINDSFSQSVFCGRGFFVPMIGGDSKDPDAVRELINEEIHRVRRQGLDRKDFDTVKITTYADLVVAFGNVSSVGRALFSSQLAGLSAYEKLETAAAVTFEDACRVLEEIEEDNSCLSVIEPETK